MDSTFIGIPYSDWRFINSFAPWLSAVGTILAVIVSLCLARRDKLRLDIRTVLSYLQRTGSLDREGWISIIIVNKGIRRTTVNYYGLYINKKTYQIKPRNDGISSLCPITLNDGEVARYLLYKEDFLEGINKFNKGKINGVKVYAEASSGEKFTKKISKSVIMGLKA